jgi:hypothetical protein
MLVFGLTSFFGRLGVLMESGTTSWTSVTFLLRDVFSVRAGALSIPTR